MTTIPYLPLKTYPSLWEPLPSADVNTSHVRRAPNFLLFPTGQRNPRSWVCPDPSGLMEESFEYKSLELHYSQKIHILLFCHHFKWINACNLQWHQDNTLIMEGNFHDGINKWHSSFEKWWVKSVENNGKYTDSHHSFSLVCASSVFLTVGKEIVAKYVQGGEI